MTIVEELAVAGLSAGETRVYVALLELGSSTTGPISARAGISAAKVYPVLEKLLKKGLASFVFKNNVRFYSACSPNRLIDFLHKKEEALHKNLLEVEGMLPQLKGLRMPERYSVEMFFGLEGIKSAADEALEALSSGDEVLAAGLTEGKGDVFNRYWLSWNKKRLSKKVGCRLLFTGRSKYSKNYSKHPRTSIRYLSEVYPAAIDVMGDKVLIFTYGDNPACVVITNREIAFSFKNFFESLWKIAKK